MWPLRDIHSKLDQLIELQARHSALLAEHERRSLANEAAVLLLRNDLSSEAIRIRSELTPLKSHVAAWAGVGKSITILGALAGMGVAVWRIFGVA